MYMHMYCMYLGKYNHGALYYSENVHTYTNAEMLSPLFFKSHTDLILRYQSAEVGI